MIKKTLLNISLLCSSLYANQETIVFGAGCFWGVQKHFQSLKGIVDTRVGYAGGNYKNPTYEDLLKYKDTNNNNNIINHTEVVQIVYDNTKISTQKLIEEFWQIHNPTQGNQQGNDIGNNYRSVIFYTNDNQKQIALKTKDEYQKLLDKSKIGTITTQITKLDKFYEAESYHQDYLIKNPNGYCPNHSTGIKFDNNNLSPHNGKEILVIKSDACIYCKKFKDNVIDLYKGNIPLREAYQDQLNNFILSTDIQGTPTIIFVENKKELYRHTGFMDSDTFYKALGKFKLGINSEAFNVAFNQSTDNKFCKQYDIFKNTPDGVFVDKLSGDIIFDTKDRFNSHSGWLSFTKAVDGSVILKNDNSYNMHRTEVIAKISGVHLGHVFDDGPNNQKRFCINATVLNFIKR